MLDYLSRRQDIQGIPYQNCIAAAEEWLIRAGVPAHQVREILGKKTIKRINEITGRRKPLPSQKQKATSPDRVPAKHFAKCLRATATDSEKMLWKWLHERSGMRGWVFQHPVLDYVIDFYHAKTRIGIELDGSFHAGRQNYDARRDAKLKQYGIRIIRIPSKMMFEEPSFVYRSIKQAIDNVMNTKVRSATELLKQIAEKEANVPPSTTKD